MNTFLFLNINYDALIFGRAKRALVGTAVNTNNTHPVNKFSKIFFSCTLLAVTDSR